MGTCHNGYSTDKIKLSKLQIICYKYTTYKLVEITSDRITVYNTRSGKKYWEVNYLGVVTMSKYNNFEFHKYYLVNKGVYFYISVKRVFTGPGDVLHYMIEFDGELQFAV